MEPEKRTESETIEKYDIKLKNKPKDGVILQLHHTVKNSNGECRRIRFSTGSFDDLHEKLACLDNVGNLFVLDFAELKFWKLTSVGPCSGLHFVPNKLDILVVATSKKFDVKFLNVETGRVNTVLSGHSAPAKHISFSNDRLNTFLTASHSEAILWEMKSYTKYFTLNTYLGAHIEQIMFTPAGEYLVACFQNDTVQIWKHETMKSVKQIIPNELKHMKSIAFTMNCRAMAMAGSSPTLILFSMDTWKALKSIDLTKYSIAGAQHIEFIPQVFDGGANRILAILTNDCKVCMLDLEALTIVHTVRPETSGIRRFVISPTGKYLLCILQLGEVNIYNTSYVLETSSMNQQQSVKKEIQQPSTSHKPDVQEDPIAKAEIEQKMKICMDSARLRRILTQYGEYPEKFRASIWRSLLNIPRNKNAYMALVDKGIHPAYRDIEKQFTIHSAITLKNLKRLLSCLAHWCPLFGVMKFLPGFVFPFVKVLQKDPLLLFECVATILLNYCQLWFEYAPFPPISVLAIIENILGESEPQLLNHFCEFKVTSQAYALQILETAFSEVLTCSEWLILWDHILSNEPAFILMAVVSYSIVQKNAIKKLDSQSQIENFFHMQNPVCKKTFLKKIYTLLSDTSDEIHPRRFFNSFMSLARGDNYQQFTGYPKATICLKLANRDKRKEKNEKCTLKELTTKSQERIIKDRLRNRTSETKACYSDDDSLVDVYASEKFTKKSKKKNNEHAKCPESYLKKHLNSTEINTIMYPAHVHRSKIKGQFDAKPIRPSKESSLQQPSHSKSRKKSYKVTSHDSLEKEVEKLMESYSSGSSGFDS